MKFVLDGKTVEVEVSPSTTEALDESFDSGKITLRANGEKNPYRPGTDCVITFDSGKTRYYIVDSDSVSVFSANPLSYKHEVILAEGVQRLKRRMVRNMVFSQPPRDLIRSYSAQGINFINDGSKYATSSSADTIGLPLGEALPTDARMRLGRMRHRVTIRRLTSNNGQSRNWRLVQGYTEALSELEYIKFEAEDGTSKEYPAEDVVTQIGEWEEPSYKIRNVIESMASKGSVKAGFYEAHYAGYSLPFVDFSWVTYVYEIEAEVYYHTVGDVLQAIADSDSHIIDGSARRTPAFVLPTEQTKGSRLYEIMSEPAPNIAFTQKTLLECVMELLRHFDAVPTLDEHGLLDIDYLNDQAEEAKTQNTGYTSSWGSKDFADGMVSYYQNGRMPMSFPDSNGNLAGLRCASLGVPQEGEFALIVTEAIDLVTKCEILAGGRIFNQVGSGGYAITLPMEYMIDITDRVMERSLWTLLDKKVDIVDYERNQNNTIPYDKGSKEINVSQYFKGFLGFHYDVLSQVIRGGLSRWLGCANGHYLVGPASGDAWADVVYPEAEGWGQVKIRAEYIANVDGRARVESPQLKQEGEFLSNQADGYIDIRKMGLSMLGYSMREGNPTMTTSHFVESDGKRVEKGSWTKDDRGLWVANSVRYTEMDGYAQGFIEWVLNFNQISSRISVDRSPRLSNISGELATKCEDAITDYLIFDGSGTAPEKPSSKGCMKYIDLRELVRASFPVNGPLVERKSGFAYIKDMRSLGKTYQDPVAIPLRKYALGNCVCMEMSYDSAMSAGNRLTVTKSGWWGASTKYFSEAVKYTDRSGFMDTVTVCIGDNKSWESYPYVPSGSTDDLITIPNYRYCKRPNEIFALNYELCVVPEEKQSADCFVGTKYLEEFPLVKERSVTQPMRLYFRTDGSRFSPLEKATGNFWAVKAVEVYGTPIRVRIHVENAAGAPNAWALADSKGNIYFASNIRQEWVDERLTFYLRPSTRRY